jgi:hypothetical protein
MVTYSYSGLLGILTGRAEAGNMDDIDFIMSYLNPCANFATTRYVDFALSLVTNEEGLQRIKYYLFSGNQIQRNYATLFLNRIGEYEIVAAAYKIGLIDNFQAFSR